MFFLSFVLSLPAFASGICPVCLYTPAPVSELRHGKGGEVPGETNRVEKLSPALFTGELFYSIDGGPKAPLPEGKGVYFELNDRKRHTFRILGPGTRSWSRFFVECAEYAKGTRVVFEPYGFYSAGWKTYPLAHCRFEKKD